VVSSRFDTAMQGWTARYRLAKRLKKSSEASPGTNFLTGINLLNCRRPRRDQVFDVQPPVAGNGVGSGQRQRGRIEKVRARVRGVPEEAQAAEGRLGQAESGSGTFISYVFILFWTATLCLRQEWKGGTSVRKHYRVVQYIFFIENPTFREWWRHTSQKYYSKKESLFGLFGSFNTLHGITYTNHLEHSTLNASPLQSITEIFYIWLSIRKSLILSFEERE